MSSLPSDDEALALADCDDLAGLMAVAAALRDQGHGANVSYSRKVFIPLTRLCRDSCHYCTFAQPPRRNAAAFLTLDEVLAVARAGDAADCKEALFTLGDKPELRYRAAREELARLGHDSTISYLAAMAALVLRETRLLPHVNPGVMTSEEIARLRAVSVSQGLMLETAAERLSRRGGPHFGSPDKQPAMRLATIAAAGEAAVPFTSGILIGIGETRRERIEALLLLREEHHRHGHLQEIIIQNFRAKPGTRMAAHPEPPLDEQLWTIAVARILFGAAMNIQAPPNLRADALERLIAAGINDWGGVSPVTPDHVNPERPWPALDALARATAAAGKVLLERLAVYPSFVERKDRWIAAELHARVLRLTDSEGFARSEAWTPGADVAPPRLEWFDAISTHSDATDSVPPSPGGGGSRAAEARSARLRAGWGELQVITPPRSPRFASAHSRRFASAFLAPRTAAEGPPMPPPPGEGGSSRIELRPCTSSCPCCSSIKTTDP
jgi:FO synthase